MVHTTVARRAACAALGCALVLTGTAALTACGPQDAPVATEQVQGRRFTVPQAYFGSSMDEKACIQNLEEQGGSDVVHNADGTYTVTMSDASFDAFVKADYDRTCRLLDAIPLSQSFPQVTRVGYNEDLTQVDFGCAKADMGSQGENAANMAIYAVCLHETIAGKPLSCTVRLVDGTGAVLDTFSVPEAD